MRKFFHSLLVCMLVASPSHALMFGTVRFPDLNAPRQISGLQRLFAVENNTQEAGARVVTWSDSSGNARNYTAGSGTTARPTYTANIFNGRPGMRFDGTANTMTGGSNNDLVNTAAWTLVAAANRDAFPGTSNYFGQLFNIKTDSASFNVAISLADLSTYNRQVVTGYGGAVIMGAVNPMPATTNVYLTFDFNGGARATVGNYSLNSNAAAQTLSSTTSWGVSNANILGSFNSASAFYKGYIGNWFYYNKTLSTAEKRIVNVYMQRLYNQGVF